MLHTYVYLSISAELQRTGSEIHTVLKAGTEEGGWGAGGGWKGGGGEYVFGAQVRS